MRARQPLTTCALAALGAIAVVSPAPSLVAAAARQSNASSSHLVFAVVRNDGLLLPFAAFDGRKWSTPWPDQIEGPGAPDLPANLASVPEDWWGGAAPGLWNLWPRGAASATRIALQSPVMMRIGASRQLGFRTDRPPVPPPVPPFELPFPKMGIAIAGDANLEPISAVSPLAPPWKTLTVSLRDEIDKAEERSIRALRGNARWTHPFKLEARAKVPQELEAWYIARLADSSINLSYVEVVKKYPLLPADEGCGLETFVSGWIHHDDGLQKPRARLKAVITYCDRRGVSYMLPFGQLRVAGRTHWVVQMSARDHEWYAVIEGRADEAKYVAEYQAGRLPLE
jgi:hypothetical protein